MTAIPRNHIEAPAASGPRLWLVNVKNSERSSEGNRDLNLSVVKTNTPKQREMRVEGVPGLVIIHFRTGNRFYVYRFRDPISGRRNSMSLGSVESMTLMVAAARVKELTDAIKSGRSPLASRMTVDEFVIGYFNPWSIENKASFSDDDSRYRGYVQRFIGDKAIDQVTLQDLKKVVKYWADGNPSKHGRRLKLATVNQIIMLLRTIFRVAMDLGFIAVNASKGLRAFKLEAPNPKALDAQQVRKFGLALDGEPPRPVLLSRFLLTTAMRVGEALKLRQTDVDKVQKIAYLQSTKSGVPQIVHLSEAALAVLAELEGLQRQGNPYIFPAVKGNGPMAVPRKWLTALFAKAGLEHAGFHIFRRVWASQAMSIEIDVLTVSRHLRHQSIRTTERHYIANPTQRLRDASHLVGELLTLQLGVGANVSVSPITNLLRPSVRSVCITSRMRFVVSRRVAMP